VETKKVIHKMRMKDVYLVLIVLILQGKFLLHISKNNKTK